MFDWLKKLFGEGIARFSFVLADGRRGNAKVPYIGEWNESEAKRVVMSQLLVQYGSKVTELEFVGRTGT